eukprot:scaffold57201_cov59-Attheya_sp.AAC.2
MKLCNDVVQQILLDDLSTQFVAFIICTCTVTGSLPYAYGMYRYGPCGPPNKYYVPELRTRGLPAAYPPPAA